MAKKLKKETLNSKLSKKAIDGAYAYRESMRMGYIDIKGTTIPSVRMRNRVNDFFEDNSNIRKAELVTLMHMKTTHYRILVRPNLTKKERDKVMNKLLGKTTIGPHSKRTLKQFIVEDSEPAQFASESIETSDWEEHAKEFFSDDVQKKISSAFNSVI